MMGDGRGPIQADPRQGIQGWESKSLRPEPRLGVGRVSRGSKMHRASGSARRAAQPQGGVVGHGLGVG